MKAQLVNNYSKLAVALKIDFPYYYRDKLLKLVFIQFLIVFLFLYLFKPFGYDPTNHAFDYAWICFFQAFSPAIIVYGYFLILNHRYQRHPSFRWTIGLQLLHSVFVLFFIGLASFGLRTVIYDEPDSLSGEHLLTELKNVYLAGTLLVIYLLISKFHIRQKSTPSTYSQNVTIKTATKKDDFTLHHEQFVYAKAEGNYVDLYCKKQDSLKKELKRISLKNLNAQLKSYPQFVRCHRAYLVNTKHIVKVTGNAQGYLLCLNNTTEKIPVSRTYLPLFENLLNDLKKG